MINDVIEIKETTALRKIAAMKGKTWVVQGGAGASKTFSILMLLINHAAANNNKEIYIVSHELSKMRETVIKDFVKIMKGFQIFQKQNWVGGTLYRFTNGSIIKFLPLDKVDVGKGLRSDIVYFNEADKITFDAYQQLASRAKRVIIDFNPERNFWVHDEVIGESGVDFLLLTHEDNEYLSKEERSKILSYYKKGFDENGNEINGYWANKHRVFCLGQIGRRTGAIFENWVIGDFIESDRSGYGLDFGSRDPDALVHCSIDKKNLKIYIKELIYQNGLSTSELGNVIKEKVNINKLIIADSQATRTIQDLKNDGLNIKAVSKNKIIDDIKLIQDYELIIDSKSKNLINELQNYVWLDRKGEVPSDTFNHAIDAARYIIQTLLEVNKKRKMRLLI